MALIMKEKDPNERKNKGRVMMRRTGRRRINKRARITPANKNVVIPPEIRTPESVRLTK